MPEEQTENQGTENGVNENAPRKLSYEELEAELKSVRSEAASRRITNRELEEKAKQWEEYQESQKTEQQKLEDRLRKQDEDLAKYRLRDLKSEIAKQFELDSEDADLLTGSDEATIRKSAERLKARLEKNSSNSNRPADLLGGNRGTPIGGNTGSFDDFIRNSVRR